MVLFHFAKKHTKGLRAVGIICNFLLVLSAAGIMNAFSGKAVKPPVIGNILQKERKIKWFMDWFLEPKMDVDYINLRLHN